MPLKDDLCNYTGEGTQGTALSLSAINMTSTGHSKFNNIRERENNMAGGGGEKINTTFTVQFFKGHFSGLSGGID